MTCTRCRFQIDRGGGTEALAYLEVKLRTPLMREVETHYFCSICTFDVALAMQPEMAKDEEWMALRSDLTNRLAAAREAAT